MPKAKFTWRKTPGKYSLLGWSDVLTNAELPFEYVGSPGQKFWYVPPIVVEKVAYIEHIRLGQDSTVPGKLAVGTVLTAGGYDQMMDYLCAAGKRLSRIKKEIEEGEEFVIQV